VHVGSVDVIHSFWVPRLGGKLDAIPGRTGIVRLQADQAGTFRGQCAEFCGLGHAHMVMTVIAMPAAEFDAWLTHKGSPPTMTEPTDGAPDRPEHATGGAARRVRGRLGQPARLARAEHRQPHQQARRFMVTGAVFFLIAGLLGMLLRAQLAQPNQGFMGAQAYNQAFTMHGTMMMFLFAVPIQQGLAAYLLPKMLGARDLVFPRLGAFGYWCYLFGG
jgi:hypothetical protein